MAAFGVPQAHEDDALRAARAALAMRAAVDELELEARIGIEAGEVVVDGSESTFATGEAVNLAARLQEAARPGEILVGPTAYRLAAGSLVVEDAGPLELKGIDGHLRAWRVVDMLDGPARPIGPRAPLVGSRRRSWSFSRTRSTAACATAARTCSRSTAKPASERAASRASSSTGSSGRAFSLGARCPTARASPYWPLGEMVKAAAGISGRRPARGGVREAARVLRRGGRRRRARPCRRAHGGPRRRAQPAGDRVGGARGHARGRRRPAVDPPVRGHPLGRAALARPHRAPRRLGTGAPPHRLPRAARAARRASRVGRRARAIDGDRARAPFRSRRAPSSSSSSSISSRVPPESGRGPCRGRRSSARRAIRSSSRRRSACSSRAAMQATRRSRARHAAGAHRGTHRPSRPGREDAAPAGVGRRSSLLEGLARSTCRPTCPIRRRSSTTCCNGSSCFASRVRRSRARPRIASSMPSSARSRTRGLAKLARAQYHARFAEWLAERTGEELIEIRAYHLDQAVEFLTELEGAPPEELAQETADALVKAARRAIAREAYANARSRALRALELRPTLGLATSRPAPPGGSRTGAPCRSRWRRFETMPRRRAIACTRRWPSRLWARRR